MTQRRERTDQRDQVGQSRFAQRGQSHEERMSEDDSAQRFPGEARGRQDVRYDARRPAPPREGSYGSGGSYGYGGGFEHGGQAGYQEQRGDYGRGGEEFYESTGGFGHEVGNYGREGLGYPGRGEDRVGSPGARDFRRTPQQGRDDRHEGYSQSSGYAQSGGQHPEGGSDNSANRGTGYGPPSAHSDGRGHQGGGHGQRFYGNSSGNAGNSQPGRGRFYGRTPQGYTRSDDRIREDICDQLSHGHIDPSDISVKVENGVVTLEGFADSRNEKFHIEEVADGVLGVKEIENRVRVRRAGQETGAQQASKTESAEQPENGKTKNNVKGASS